MTPALSQVWAFTLATARPGEDPLLPGSCLEEAAERWKGLALAPSPSWPLSSGDGKGQDFQRAFSWCGD